MSNRHETAKVLTAEAQVLVGRKITKVEYAEDPEFGYTPLLTLDDGTEMRPMKDAAGNGIGALWFEENPGGLQCLPEM